MPRPVEDEPFKKLLLIPSSFQDPGVLDSNSFHGSLLCLLSAACLLLGLTHQRGLKSQICPPMLTVHQIDGLSIT